MRIFFSRTIFAHFCISAGPPGENLRAAADCLDSELLQAFLDAREANTALALRLINSTTGFGVPAGANKPNQTMMSNPGSPASETVG